MAKRVRSLWHREGDRLVLTPHVGQKAVWLSTARIVAFISGTQAGKTSFGPFWLWREIYGPQPIGRGGGDYIAVTASYDLFKLKMLPELRGIFERVLGLGRYWAGDKVMELRDPETGQFWARKATDPMWGRIILRSAQSEGGLESATAKAAWLDEAGQESFGLQAWEAVRRRLSLNRGRVLITTTPYNLGWLKQQIYDKWVAGNPDYFVLQAASTVNPLFPQEEFEEAGRDMAAWKFAMFYKGLFDRPAGLIYNDFTDDLKISPFAIPPEWPRYVGVDFGPVHNVTLWLAHDQKKNVYYAYRETMDGNKTTEEHSKAALEYAKEENVVRWQGGAKGEKQQRMDWSKYGVPLREPPVDDVESGIDRVISLLKNKRLKVFNTMEGLLADFGSYSRKMDERGNPTDEISNKSLYHYVDALRYCVLGATEGNNFLDHLRRKREPAPNQEEEEVAA